MLTLVPCDHVWLEVKTTGTQVVAICKHKYCKQRGEFSLLEWGALAVEGKAINKPVRV